jgi:integrase
LYKTITVRNKHGKAYKKNIPQFEVRYIASAKAPIYRDIPNKAFVLLFDHIAMNHKELLGLVMHQAFAGLRPSEACNVRQMDSPLGAGIRIREVNGNLMGVSIDISDEYNLRSDLLSVGGIKKERIANVPDIFLDAYKDAYDIYMEYMEGRPYEAEYGAFSVNKQGKAITYDSYYKKFREIIKEEMIPIYLQSSDPDIVLYGQNLMEHSLSPHVFRHWFTVQLVLSGINEPGVLMKFRGDSSPESALTYINSKGDLEKQYSRINNETFNYSLWAAKEKHNERV